MGLALEGEDGVLCKLAQVAPDLVIAFRDLVDERDHYREEVARAGTKQAETAKALSEAYLRNSESERWSKADQRKVTDKQIAIERARARELELRDALVPLLGGGTDEQRARAQAALDDVRPEALEPWNPRITHPLLAGPESRIRELVDQIYRKEQEIKGYGPRMVNPLGGGNLQDLLNYCDRIHVALDESKTLIRALGSTT